MIKAGDVYKIVEAMTPLYAALVLGYASVKWWRMFNSDNCHAINRFNCYFLIPFVTFQFTYGIDPYAFNFRFLGGDVVAKAIFGVVLVLWVNLSKKQEEKFSWAITSFSLACFSNTVIIGVPLLKAMYGAAGQDLVVQSCVIQGVIWIPILLFMYDLRRANCSNNTIPAVVDGAVDSLTAAQPPSSSWNFGATMKIAGKKFLMNPNCYARILGIIWALVAKRWDLKMPSIVEGSIAIMAKAGGGVSMFSVGMFMALQNQILPCGIRLTLYGIGVRFVGGPLTSCIGSLAFGLRSNTLRIVIIQAALPQAINCFVFAVEYGVHADILGTSVTFGTLISLPLLIVLHIILQIF